MMRASAVAGSVFPLRSRLIMRWLLLTLTLFSIVLCVTRHGAGAMAWWLLVGVIGTIATTLAFAQAKIARNSRNDSLSEYELRRLREGKEELNHGRSTSER
jgi:hypothetical protein